MSTLNYAAKLALASSRTKGQISHAGRTSRWGGASIRVAAVAAVGLLVLSLGVTWVMSRKTPVVEVEFARSAGRAITPVLTSEDRARFAVISHALEGSTGLSEAERHLVSETLFVEAKRNALDPLLLLAVASHESSFRKSAVSYAGARGLMQVMPATAKAITDEMGIRYPGDSALHDPVFSIKLGAYYLARMRHHEPRLDMALTAYNMGLGRLREIKATRELNESIYSRKVMSFYRRYQRQYLMVALDRPIEDADKTFTAFETGGL